MNLDWKVYSSNGGVARELNGSTEIEVLEPQSIQLVVDTLDWNLENGLNSEIYLFTLVREGLEKLKLKFQYSIKP